MRDVILFDFQAASDQNMRVEFDHQVRGINYRISTGIAMHICKTGLSSSLLEAIKDLEHSVS